jgi:histidine kinase/DNA gyrase B/HSP90-like ATPase
MKSSALALVDRVSIRPEVTILSVLQHLNYRPWFALAEFVDNSLQSFLAHRKEIERVDGRQAKLRVEIETNSEEGGLIVIRDNAAGIYQSEFPRAFRPAELPPDTKGLSEFGMGMKSAACWFAKNWSVRTSALGEAVERKVTFDIAEIIDDRIEELKVKSRNAEARKHYTEITLWNLHHPPKGRTLGKIREHLASIYRMFLRDGTLILTVDRDPLHHTEPAVLVAPPYRTPTSKPRTWRKDVGFQLGKGVKVSGFAALRETASLAYAGFALFRRKRLIEGSADEPYRPPQIFGNANSYRYQRVFGEFTLDGFDVSHTKDGFRWEEHEDLFLSTLKKELERGPIDLLGQAEGHRAKPPRKSIKMRAAEATDHVADIVERDVKPLLTKESRVPARPGRVPESVPRSTLQASEKTVAVDDGKRNWEVTVRTSVDPGIGPWLRIGDRAGRKEKGRDVRSLTIDIALDHPFVEQFLGPSNENVELFVRFAVAIAISLILGEDATGANANFALHHLNSLLRDALSHP